MCHDRETRTDHGQQQVTSITALQDIIRLTIRLQFLPIDCQLPEPLVSVLRKIEERLDEVCVQITDDLSATKSDAERDANTMVTELREVDQAENEKLKERIGELEDQLAQEREAKRNIRKRGYLVLTKLHELASLKEEKILCLEKLVQPTQNLNRALEHIGRLF